MSHCAALFIRCTAEITDYWDISRCYGNSNWNVISRKASSCIIARGTDDQRTILMRHVAVTATAAVVTVTDRDKVHRSTAVSWRWQLIQQASQRCPMSIRLIRILQHKQHLLVHQKLHVRPRLPTKLATRMAFNRVHISVMADDVTKLYYTNCG